MSCILIASPESKVNTYTPYMLLLFHPIHPADINQSHCPRTWLACNYPSCNGPGNQLQLIRAGTGQKTCLLPWIYSPGFFLQLTTENTHLSAFSSCSPSGISAIYFLYKPEWDDWHLKGTVNGKDSHLVVCFFVPGSDTCIELLIHRVVWTAFEVD